jgi:hypothetical protein
MILSLGFRRTLSEHAIYVRQNGDAQLVVGVYIDDLVITSSDCDDIKSFKEEMAAAFKMSNLSMLHYYLSIEVKQSMSGISLSQGAYAMKLLERCGLARCNPCQTPMEARLKLSKQSTQPLVDATAYQSIVGSLKYLVNTCPNLAFAVGYVSHFLGAAGGSPCSGEADSPLCGRYQQLGALIRSEEGKSGAINKVQRC